MNHYYKYPKTYHFPHSPGLQNDDRLHPNISIFEDKEVIATIKMDGENCLDQNTKIETENGVKTIRWICENKYSGKVKCYNIETEEIVWQKVINWSILENIDGWYEIELENGITIILTSNHYVYLPDLMCYRKVKDLNCDEFLLLK